MVRKPVLSAQTNDEAVLTARAVWPERLSVKTDGQSNIFTGFGYIGLDRNPSNSVISSLAVSRIARKFVYTIEEM